ncbi:MAG: penicillin-binding transpeptidase domain-containing protein, partial [Actinomycetota bacterium]|nr:penicillin-binding transpeptidase domain-containing protein [Actinomycetota bacterium]
GTVLARSVGRGSGSRRTFTRRYPTGPLFSHAVGYNFISKGRAGLERSRNDELTGKESEFGSIFSQLQSEDREGQDVTTTLDPRAQRVALQALGGRKGSVVALDPRSGAVKVMASVPGFDPTALRSPRTFSALNRDRDAPLFNRATQSGYPPGSTFKVVTAIAALDSGRFTPSSSLSGRNGIEISGVPLNNDGGESFGVIDLTTALTQSVNVVWAQVAEQLGKETMGRYMKRLGFNAEPQIDLPSDQLRPSGEYRNGKALSPTSRFVDVGRMAIGQDKLNVTPLQMAMVAAAVANDGKLMRPRLTRRVVDVDGRTVEEVEPEVQSTVMSAAAARQLGQMMSRVVQEGTGTAAALSGIDVAGKTGTAEVDRPCGPNQLWFIAFAPTERPRVAIAVTVECGTGFGGTVAAPIAKQVMEALL